MNIIRTRHLRNGRVVKTYNGKVIFRGYPQDYPVSPDSRVGEPVDAAQLDSQGKT